LTYIQQNIYVQAVTDASAQWTGFGKISKKQKLIPKYRFTLCQKNVVSKKTFLKKSVGQSPVLRQLRLDKKVIKIFRGKTSHKKRSLKKQIFENLAGKGHCAEPLRLNKK
jgi:hypothetical protein